MTARDMPGDATANPLLTTGHDRSNVAMQRFDVIG
jgi:hypothetical protein